MALVLLTGAASESCSSDRGGTKPKPQAPQPAEKVVKIRINTFDSHGVIIKRKTVMTITALQDDGQIGWIVGKDGKRVREPYTTYPNTPIIYENTILPGIVTVSFTVTYLGKKGDILECYLTYNGKEVPGRHQKQIKEVGPNGNGAAQVTCLFAVP